MTVSRTRPAPQRKRRRTRAEIERAGKRRASARKRNLAARHRMTVEQYDSLKAFQDGMCFICHRATGVVRQLAVDHNHRLAYHGHDTKESCCECWRGLLCAVCNRMLAHGRDDPLLFCRAAAYLQNPPAQQWRLTCDCR